MLQNTALLAQTHSPPSMTLIRARCSIREQRWKSAPSAARTVVKKATKYPNRLADVDIRP